MCMSASKQTCTLYSTFISCNTDTPGLIPGALLCLVQYNTGIFPWPVCVHCFNIFIRQTDDMNYVMLIEEGHRVRHQVRNSGTIFL